MSQNIPVADRRIPPFGGFNLRFLGVEIKRRLRNRRTLIFNIVMPVGLYLLIGLPLRNVPLQGSSAFGGGLSYASYMLVSMAVYGAMVAAATAGGAVAIERATGWSRQLRLTPLNPAAYIAMKVVSGLVMGLIAVVATFLAGAFTGIQLPWYVWLLSGLTAWLGSLVMTSLGLLLGYLVPSENVMQFLGPILAILSIFGGLFTPLSNFPQMVQDIARWTPVYGLGEIARAPLVGDAFDWLALLSLVVWLVIFSIGAALAFRRDTKRV